MKLNTLLGLLAAVCLGLTLSNVACLIAYTDLDKEYSQEMGLRDQSDSMLRACQAGN